MRWVTVYLADTLTLQSLFQNILISIASFVGAAAVAAGVLALRGNASK